MIESPQELGAVLLVAVMMLSRTVSTFTIFGLVHLAHLLAELAQKRPFCSQGQFWHLLAFPWPILQILPLLHPKRTSKSCEEIWTNFDTILLKRNPFSLERSQTIFESYLLQIRPMRACSKHPEAQDWLPSHHHRQENALKISSWVCNNLWKCIIFKLKI